MQWGAYACGSKNRTSVQDLPCKANGFVLKSGARRWRAILPRRRYPFGEARGCLQAIECLCEARTLGRSNLSFLSCMGDCVRTKSATPRHAALAKTSQMSLHTYPG